MSHLILDLHFLPSKSWNSQYDLVYMKHCLKFCRPKLCCLLFLHFKDQHPGPGGSKVMTLLMFHKNPKNILNMPNFLLLKRCEKLLHCKNFSHFLKKISVYFIKHFRVYILTTSLR